MANKIYLTRETPVVYNSSVGGAKAFSIASLANGQGWRGERLDLGAGSKPYKFEWRAYFQLNTSPLTVTGGEVVDLFIATSDGTIADGGLATTEGLITSDFKRFNLQEIGSVRVDSTTDVNLMGSGVFEVSSRYFSPVIFNFTTIGFSAFQSAVVNNLTITPIVEEIQ